MQIISCWKKLAIILSALKSNKSGRRHVVIPVTAPGLEGSSLNKALVWSGLAPRGQSQPAGDRPSSFLGPVLALHHLGQGRVRLSEQNPKTASRLLLPGGRRAVCGVSERQVGTWL